MPNEDDVWEFSDDVRHELSFRNAAKTLTNQKNLWCIASDKRASVVVTIPFEKVRELRDWLTAKLEGNGAKISFGCVLCNSPKALEN